MQAFPFRGVAGRGGLEYDRIAAQTWYLTSTLGSNVLTPLPLNHPIIRELVPLSKNSCNMCTSWSWNVRL